MSLLKNIELEWKIFFLGIFIFLAISWPLQRFISYRFESMLHQSIDPQLDSLLRENITSLQDSSAKNITISALERTTQWKALVPLLVKEQRQVLLGISSILFLIGALFAFYILSRLTNPIKSLALSVRQIAKGNPVVISQKSGGALGVLEKSIASLQEELKVMREQAQIQGMERAWQDIARIMAHEIKNPLTPMRLTIDRIQEKLQNNETIAPEKLGKAFDRINNQLDTLDRLVNQFRSFSKDPETNLSRILIHESIYEIASDMSSKIQTKVFGQAIVSADRYLISQVLLNLWKNSLEAGASEIVVTVQKNGSFAEIKIADNGKGIPENERDRIWLPYVSLKNGGTGLGLPIVKRMVETMKGSIVLLDSKPQNSSGVTMLLTLPACNEVV